MKRMVTRSWMPPHAVISLLWTGEMTYEECLGEKQKEEQEYRSKKKRRFKSAAHENHQIEPRSLRMCDRAAKDADMNCVPFMGSCTERAQFPYH
mmetsp:Transcript_51227/g.69752  ORF Transcript_51227/g.69752 Transcript_51227/m.69752 type:complete len:94 (-) Transcript_51227:45-326(-)